MSELDWRIARAIKNEKNNNEESEYSHLISLPPFKASK